MLVWLCFFSLSATAAVRMHTHMWHRDKGESKRCIHLAASNTTSLGEVTQTVLALWFATVARTPTCCHGRQMIGQEKYDPSRPSPRQRRLTDMFKKTGTTKENLASSSLSLSCFLEKRAINIDNGTTMHSPTLGGVGGGHQRWGLLPKRFDPFGQSREITFRNDTKAVSLSTWIHAATMQIEVVTAPKTQKHSPQGWSGPEPTPTENCGFLGNLPAMNVRTGGRGLLQKTKQTTTKKRETQHAQPKPSLD